MKLELKDIGTNNLDFIGSAIDHGINSIKEGNILVPFVFTQENEKKKLNRFISDTTSTSIRSAEDYVNKITPKPKISVLVYEGSVGSGDNKKDAIIAKVWLRNKILIFAQPYKRGSKNIITLIGDYLYLESRD